MIRECSAITYPNLDAAKRRVIWCDFLEHAGVGIEGTSNVIKKQVNGTTSSNGATGGDEKKKEKSFEGWLSSEFVDKLAKKQDFNGMYLSPCTLADRD